LPNLTPNIDGEWMNSTGRSLLGSGAFASEYVDDAARRHPEADVIAAIIKARAGFTVIPTPQQLAVKVRSILDPLTPAVTEVAAEHEAQKAAEWERRIARTKRATHEVGGHESEADPRCPLCQGVPA
jgi:hypothetical protein